MSADEATRTWWSRVAPWEWAALALILVSAWVLRFRDVEAFRIGPDEGSYLYSARVQDLERGSGPASWIADDVAWARELGDGYADEVETYQHSYLHQLAARWLYRSGVGAVASLRANSAFLGVATVFLAWWTFAWLFPDRRRAGLAAAAVVAWMPLHAFYSRTGWGQVGFACFHLAYVVLLYRALVQLPRDDTRGFIRCGTGMLVASLLAYGWHENVAPFVVGSGMVVAAAPFFLRRAGDPGGYWACLFRSKATWTYALSAVPVGAFTLALYLWSPFAQKYWFHWAGRAGESSWLTLKEKSLGNLLFDQRVDLQVTWIVIVLAAVGTVSAWRANRAFAAYVTATGAAGSLVVLGLYGDAFLLRAYMPAYVLLALFAGEGAMALARRGRLGAAASGLALLALFATTWISLFGRIDHPLFVRHLTMQSGQALLDHRHVDDELLRYLAEHLADGQRVAVYYDKAPIFRLLDAGIHAREFTLQEPREQWPHWILGVARIMEQHHATTDTGGIYRSIARDRVGRHALYEISP